MIRPHRQFYGRNAATEPLLFEVEWEEHEDLFKWHFLRVNLELHPESSKREVVDCWVCAWCGALDLLRKKGEMPPAKTRYEGGLGLDAIARRIHDS
jgi:hypothetical protein